MLCRFEEIFSRTVCNRNKNRLKPCYFYVFSVQPSHEIRVRKIPICVYAVYIKLHLIQTIAYLNIEIDSNTFVFVSSFIKYLYFYIIFLAFGMWFLCVYVYGVTDMICN